MDLGFATPALRRRAGTGTAPRIPGEALNCAALSVLWKCRQHTASCGLRGAQPTMASTAACTAGRLISSVLRMPTSAYDSAQNGSASGSFEVRLAVPRPPAVAAAESPLCVG